MYDSNFTSLLGNFRVKKNNSRDASFTNFNIH